MTADVLVGAVLGGGGVSGVLVGVLQYWFKTREKRREEQLQRHEGWFREAEAAYERVSAECKKCRDELDKSEQRRIQCEKEHRAEMYTVKQELGDVKEALLGRIEALDLVLPHITSLPKEEVDQLRRVNQAQRAAVFRVRP